MVEVPILLQLSQLYIALLTIVSPCLLLNTMCVASYDSIVDMQLHHELPVYPINYRSILLNPYCCFKPSFFLRRCGHQPCITTVRSSCSEVLSNLMPKKVLEEIKLSAFVEETMAIFSPGFFSTDPIFESARKDVSSIWFLVATINIL